MKEMKKLYKSRTDRKISGVCGGLAEYLNIDSIIVRLAVFALIIFDLGFLLIYILAAFMLPEKPYNWSQPYEDPKMRKQTPPYE